MQDPFEDPTSTKKYLKVATFGDGGSGKTRFALSFPKPAVIDTEHGTDPYKKKHKFRVHHLNRWKQLAPVISWLKANPGVYETFVIDSATVFYQDLIQDIVDYIKNKRGNETMTKGDWGVQKRRWAAFMNLLVELPMHVVLNFREKPEYLETTSRDGEELLKKTGNYLLEADRQTKHLFDLSFRCYTEVDKKSKTAKFQVQVDKTRYNEWMPLYSAHDITGKLAFDELFKGNITEMMKGKEAKSTSLTQDPFSNPDAVAVASENVKAAEAKPEDLPAVKSTVERNGETLGKFTAQGDPDAPQATIEDVKVLMTTCGKLTWPDGSKFSSADGKTMIKGLYKLESTKELRKYQIDFLTREFGEVLAGRAELALDEEGMPYVKRKSEVKVPEVAKK